MAGSTFGTLFRVTTFGESHCKAVGAVIDGVPPGMRLSEADIQPQLTRRRPGQSTLTTPRSESDRVTILSGTEAGVTLGTPVALFIPNENVRPGDYAEMLKQPRPGHADYTYQVKYGVRASSGGGRSSARETAARVAAGAVAEKWLASSFGTRIVTFVSSVGDVSLPADAARHSSGRAWTRDEVDALGALTILRCSAAWTRHADAAAQAAADAADEAEFVSTFNAVTNGGCSFPAFTDGPVDITPAYLDAAGGVYNMLGDVVKLTAADVADRRSGEQIHVRCPHTRTAARMASLIRSVKADADSVGGTLLTVITGVPLGLGEPVFDKLEAKLAHAMLSLPATKAFEVGSGFAGTRMRGSAHNDAFVSLGADAAPIGSSSAAGHGRHAAAGGSSSGSEDALVLLRTRSNHAGGTLGGISNGADIEFRVGIKPVSTIGRAQVTATYGGEEAVLEAKGRHDPCVLPRAPPLVEAMAALVLADAALIQSTRGYAHGSLSVLPSTDAPEAGEDGDAAAAGRKRARVE